ncbi:hypothetical protein [Thermoanaerobacterium thermosaccharolyticum]|uniref:hypothetical protein n=1 Tax=Thermoanaerobacterium thermosaccharolyticum TaxID=1517 RepID=UPI00104969EA|nr:hypothetical protein [Thermoanaerobacterium thermosaccharolyticum]KAA5806236.1 hypothetical protein F1655_10515 [Thermoanaerobacterium thermosaccharolyticum]MCP2241217.1 hypothetical protein [Thermoanaerobacterium thermosaccharolyticum]
MSKFHILNSLIFLTFKVGCPHGSSWCSNSNYGYCLKVNYKKNNRYFSFPIRSSDEWQEIYNLRTSIERCNSRLKNYLNTDNLRSAGIKKAKIFALLNCITLVAGTIAVNVSASLPKSLIKISKFISYPQALICLALLLSFLASKIKV